MANSMQLPLCQVGAVAQKVNATLNIAQFWIHRINYKLLEKKILKTLMLKLQENSDTWQNYCIRQPKSRHTKREEWRLLHLYRGTQPNTVYERRYSEEGLELKKNGTKYLPIIKYKD
ncbi:hypothetical protein BpHYR1_000863 [Brachionus plicatilis]|uniref:Uncharacterized protein n=1 Tax=Brachionus plicatilis TaxID=10195 RepID=A0A3M7S3H6_BRAPC|nr:hypothetical protein BpHYR1_000863 [Brachionus plicatilis]